jgi:hypothetical protein
VTRDDDDECSDEERARDLLHVEHLDRPTTLAEVTVREVIDHPR